MSTTVLEDKAEIIAFTNNFHGRTVTIVSFSTEADYRDGFGPFTPGFRVLPYGDADAVEKAMHENVAAVLVEPIQGEAGIVLPPAGYLKRLRQIRSRHVREVRGLGLWIGIELHREAGGARRFCEALQHEGLLCKETHDHVIRIAPPLVIKKDEIDWAVERLEKVLTTL